MAEVYQISVVRQNRAGWIPKFAAALPEQLYALRCKGGGLPLLLVFGEKGKCGCAYLLCAQRGVFYSAGCRYMCTDVFPNYDVFE